MWSYKYTSSASVVTGNCRVGVRLEVATSTSHMVDLFTAAAKEQRCKCFFFDAGVEKSLASPFKTLLARPERDRARMFIGLTFPADFPCHRSAKATAQRVSSFVIAMGIGTLDLLVVPWPEETQGHRAVSDRGERQRDGALFLKTWKALQRLVEAGTILALGVDRFVPWQLDFVASQPGPKVVANFLHVSLKNQQRIITGYSHARQIEVVASLDTADVMEPTNPTDGDFRPDSTPSEDNREEEGERGEHKEEAAETINCSGGAAADDAVVDSQEPAGDACEASLSRISLETDMTPVQVVTSWSLQRGLVALHTSGSLGGGEAAPSKTTSREGKRRSSAANGVLGTGMREAFALLHPLAFRPSCFSPNKRFGFDLSAEHLEAIEAADRDSLEKTSP